MARSSATRHSAATWLEQLYILPDQQRQGIGTRLLGMAQTAAGSRLCLYTFTRNAGARRFYERHGFTPVAESDGSRNEEGEPDVRYEWAMGRAGSERGLTMAIAFAPCPLPVPRRRRQCRAVGGL